MARFKVWLLAAFKASQPTLKVLFIIFCLLFYLQTLAGALLLLFMAFTISKSLFMSALAVAAGVFMLWVWVVFLPGMWMTFRDTFVPRRFRCK